MRILQLCKKFPFPLKDGESLAVTYLSKALNELGCEVTLLAMNTSKHYFDTNHLPDDFNHYQSIYFTELDNRLNPFEAFVNLFSKDSYHITRFVSPAFEKILIQLLSENEYDIIQLESLYLAPYIDIIRQYSKAKIAMRSHNVEFEIWERITYNTKNPLKKWYLKHLVEKLKRFEIAQLNKYDLLLPITERDAKIFRKLGYTNKYVVTPIGIDNREYMANDKSFNSELSMSFIGSLDWIPNLEGVQYFLSKIWGDINRNFPTLKFHIAGRNTPGWLKSINYPNVIFHGEVNSAKDFINEHSLMLVPLQSGSGMRAKILEGMALGKVVITTPIGLEGIYAKHKEHVLIAETKEEFIDCIKFAYNNPQAIKDIANRAQVFVADNYDNLQVAKKVVNAYQTKTLELVG